MAATKERLMDLERTVDTLNEQLQDMQWELRRARGHSLKERLLKNLRGPRGGNEFMSAVCNRQVRPNLKMVEYAGTTIRH